MSYTPDCDDCPTPDVCKARNDCQVTRQIRHGHEGKNRGGFAKPAPDEAVKLLRECIPYVHHDRAVASPQRNEKAENLLARIDAFLKERA